MKNHRNVLGVSIGNCDFFPDVLVAEARTDIERLFGALGIESVMLNPSETKLGRGSKPSMTRGNAPHFSRSIGTDSTACWWSCPTSAIRRASRIRSTSPGCASRF